MMACPVHRTNTWGKPVAPHGLYLARVEYPAAVFSPAASVPVPTERGEQQAEAAADGQGREVKDDAGGGHELLGE